MNNLWLDLYKIKKDFPVGKKVLIKHLKEIGVVVGHSNNFVTCKIDVTWEWGVKIPSNSFTISVVRTQLELINETNS